MSRINSANKKRTLTLQKEKLLEELKYYERRIEEAKLSQTNQIEYEESSDSDTELPFFNNEPSITNLKIEHSAILTCFDATQELTGLQVLQSEVNVLVEDPKYDGTHCETTFNGPVLYKTHLKLPQELPQLLTISDLWTSVKNSAIAAWESLKNIADRTGERISQWISNIKIKANNLKALVKNRIENMKKEIHDVIDNIKHTGEVIKQCLQNEKENIDMILKEIIQNVTACIANNIQYLTLLEETSGELFVDKNEFINRVETKLSQCLNDDDIERCFNDVRINVYEDLEQEEKEILGKKEELRARADDILDTIANCASNGLIESAAAMTNTTIQIIKCVAKG